MDVQAAEFGNFGTATAATTHWIAMLRRSAAMLRVCPALLPPPRVPLLRERGGNWAPASALHSKKACGVAKFTRFVRCRNR